MYLLSTDRPGFIKFLKCVERKKQMKKVFLAIRLIFITAFFQLNNANAQLTPPEQEYALRFNGWQIAVAENNEALNLGGEFTIEVWVYLMSESSYALVMGKAKEHPNCTGDVIYGFMFENDGKTPAFLTTNGNPLSQTWITSDSELEYNKWSHLAGTLKSDTMKFFIDGILTGEKINTFVPPNTPDYPFTMGSLLLKEWNGKFNGILRQAKLWNRALDPIEILESAENPCIGNEQGLAACWPLDDGNGRKAFDRSSNNIVLNLGSSLTYYDEDPEWIKLEYLENPYFQIHSFSLPESVTDVSDGYPIDYDTDGDIDVIITQTIWPATYPESYAPLTLLRNDGSGIFTDVTSTDLGNVEMVSPYYFTTGDFNGDGKEDMFLIDSGTDIEPNPGGQSRILIQTGDGKLRDETGSRIPVQLSWTHNTDSGDIDGDGDLDIFMCNTHAGPNPPQLYINDGSGHFSIAVNRLPEYVADRIRIQMSSHFIDIDNDSDLDLYLGSHGDPMDEYRGRDIVLINDGTGTFTLGQPEILPLRHGGANATTLEIEHGDFNGDGFSDLLVSTIGADVNETEVYIQLLLNNRDNTFSDASEKIPQDWSPYAPREQARWINTADFNNDGLTDFSIIGVRTSNINVRLFLNKGNAEFIDASYLIPYSNRFGSGHTGDYDGDGDIDLFLVDFNGGCHFAENIRLFDLNTLPQTQVVSFFPEEGKIGTQVVITGSNFFEISRVKINRVDLTYTVNSDTQITVTIPQGVRSGYISIMSPSGIIKTPREFRVIGPSILNLFPGNGCPQTAVTISGYNFTDVISVEFNGTESSFFVTDTMSITAYVPESAATGPVKITTSDGECESLEDFIVFLPPPEQTSVLQFDGSNIAVAPLNDSLVLGREFTLEAWVYLEKGTDLSGIIMGKSLDYEFNAPVNSCIVTFRGEQNNLSIEQRISETNSVYFDEAPISDYINTWFHFAVSLDYLENTEKNGEFSIYINGELKSSLGTSADYFTDPSMPFTLGNGLASNGDVANSGFTGYLRQVRIWNKPLTKEEIHTNSSVVLSGNESGLIAYWPLDDQHGQTARDLGPYGLDLTLGISGDEDSNDPSWTVPKANYSPLITGFYPEGGFRDTTVIIYGYNFHDAVNVDFNGVDTKFTINSDSQITAVVPAGTNSGKITVTTPRGIVSSLNDFIVYISPPLQSYVLMFSDQARTSTSSSALLNPGNEFSFETWVYIDSIVNGTIMKLSSREQDSDFNFALGVDVFNGLSIGFQQSNAQPGSFANAYYSPWEGLKRWSHLACVLHADTMKLLVNGFEVVRTSSLGSTPSGLFDLTLGTFEGKLRQVRFWNRALSEAEIQAKAGMEISGSEEGLIACWQLDEGSGQTASDTGPNSVPLTLGWSAAIESVDPVWFETGDPVGINDNTSAEIPAEFSLRQNYPNPFNPETTIIYGLPTSADVSLIIYNILGQEVKRLVSAKKPAGYYKIIWDGRNNFGIKVGSGMYVYRITAGDFVKTRKMMLIK